ncbi:hypothetical protein OsJ_08571 [Oryza sativa Japonica Group]|uniref:Replication factor C C-terminal domain-containing protein n=1 Tax=Oryza sativa subsp. japonica TaxID=39947 RepID=B9F3I2_ORYSJ|nr:hypothetical protein OsJ_08571 [Oryza sativa Japonica Group]
MAGATAATPMDIDAAAPPPGAAAKGKAPLSSTPGGRAAPWVEKYRPQSLGDVAAHRDIVDTIDRLTNENRLPHLLLYGPPGTGKHRQYWPLQGSYERGIDVVRQQIQDFASARSLSFGAKQSVKMVLLDEADAMTKDAQFALRRATSSNLPHLTVIEKHTRSTRAKQSVKMVLLDEADAMTKDAQFALRRATSSNLPHLTVIEKHTRSTRFALICNHVNKIIPALQSRCTRFRFAPLDGTHVRERLKHIIQSEGLDVDDGGLTALVRLSNGDMRKALNILQVMSVYLCTGNPMPKDIEQIAYWLLNESFSTSFKCISDMKMRKGLALVDIIREVTMFVFKIQMPSDVRIKLINDLADIEYRLSFACNDKLQLGALISTFTGARTAMVAAAH